MLQRLSIQNYAIIDALEIGFSPHLNIITGETGAGKSILLGALQLILGERADLDALPDRQKKCVIEGVFTCRDTRVTQFLESQGLDREPTTMVRREISPNGKSRAFINDTPVNLDQLGELASVLVDLHQQFDTRKLGQSDVQMEILDAVCDQLDKVKAYRETYQSWKEAGVELERIRRQSLAAARELDYHRFLSDELEGLNFLPSEIENLEVELKQLTHGEDIRSALEEAYGRLEEGESPLLVQIRQVQSRIQAVSGFHPELGNLAERMGKALVELRDIAQDLSRISGKLPFDQSRLAQVNDRISEGYRLFKKHGVSSTGALLDLQESLRGKLAQAVGLEDEVRAGEEKREATRKILIAQAEGLSARRKQEGEGLVKNIHRLLRKVGMPSARLRVELRPCEAGPNGIDSLEFLFDPNSQDHFLPLRKVASGGELSRLMLCIKSLVARSAEMHTLIFDEIDTGISGEAAKQVGALLQELSVSHQVICVTHQPQIAGKADLHLYVSKEQAGDRVVTRIRALDVEERVTVIARMLAGEMPTAAAMQNAREMVGGS
ncbi:MAG TPA: DNA repair protein RecN [Chitinophagaceae bacterium]|nr:DNA repair protein RecN [Chitinophagaceae bacterium]